MQCQKIIEQLGYSRKEAKVYLACLKLGEAHVSDIASYTKMPRSTVQVILERLKDDGLMNFYVMRHHKLWVSEDPTVLARRIDKQKALIENTLPQLSQLRQKARQQNNKVYMQETLGPIKDVADSILRPVLVACNENEICYVNKAWEDAYGFKCNEVCGEHHNPLKCGEMSQAEYDKLKSSLQAGDFYGADSIVDTRKDGAHPTISTITFPIFYGNRKFYLQILQEKFTKK